MPKVRVNSLEIVYTDQGRSEHAGDVPIVLVHGFPYNRAMWDEQVQELSGEFRVVAPDLRGHGESQATPGPYTMDALAEDVKGLLDALNLPQVALGGFSMGGYVVFAFIRKYPQRVKSLLLLDTRAQADTEQGKQGREDLAKLAEQQGQAPVADRLLPRMVTEATLKQRPELVAKARAMILACSVQGIASASRGMALRQDSTELLPHIRVPTLVVVGDQDVVTPPADAEMMASRIPGAKLVKIPGAGHLSNLENPQEFTHAIHDFFHPH